MLNKTLTLVLLPLILVVLPGLSCAEEFAGRYRGESEPSLGLVLRAAADGAILGELTEPGASIPIQARRSGANLNGVVGPAGNQLPFTAEFQGQRLLLHLGAPGDAETVSFVRSDARADPDSPMRQPAQGGRHVIINGKRLSDSELAQVERAYGLRIPDADYWYDPVLGAWGPRGGPTMGFIPPGLTLGGPLQADASGGGTPVFVNGRALHPYDLMALQQLTGPIMPGRYFITAQGLAGYEGGPPLWNLMAMAAQSGGGGGSNTWQSRITGASGFSDGTTGAVFLPNGGIVSTGH